MQRQSKDGNYKKDGNTQKRDIEHITRELASLILEQEALKQKRLELVDVAYQKEGAHWFLRVFIDKEDGGVDIEDLSQVSEQLSKRLDEEDPIAGSYILEVSSPGAERPLKTEKDVQRAIGKVVEVKTYEPVEGRKVHVGELLAVGETEWLLNEGEQDIHIPKEKIARARLTVSFNEKISLPEA